MIARNLRHLRLFLAVVDLHSLTRAADLARVTQSAVTQAIAKIEADAGGALFDRSKQGFFANPRGLLLANRARRAFDILDPALNDLGARLRLTISHAQLQALIAVHEAENFTLAARRLGLAQPTVHRAVTQVEHEAGRSLFERRPFGMVPTRPCQALTQAARLALYELDQADADLAEAEGREVGRIVIGAMPLSRSVLLPRALVAFRKERPRLSVEVQEGPYDDLLTGLRRGQIDFLVGALRDPAPIGDVEQAPLFMDSLVLLSSNHHPLAKGQPGLAALRDYPWIVPRRGTPTRSQFEALFTSAGLDPPESVIDSGSILLMREMLEISDHLACISHLQANAEIAKGLLRVLDLPLDKTLRPIGITRRRNWQPTAAQSLLLRHLRALT